MEARVARNVPAGVVMSVWVGAVPTVGRGVTKDKAEGSCPDEVTDRVTPINTANVTITSRIRAMT